MTINSRTTAPSVKKAATLTTMDAKNELPLVIECTTSTDAGGIQAQYRYDETFSSFMNELPRAAYTTFVSLDGAYIAQLDFHVKRLVEGICRLEPTAKVASVSLVKYTLCSMIDEAFKFHTLVGYDLQFVSALIVSEDMGTKLRMHISYVKRGTHRTDTVTVECGGKPRMRPRIKNSAWFHQRKPLQYKRSKDAFETILVDKDSDGLTHLYEGLVSNLFVITKQMELYTAADDMVLPGSTRQLVLESCGVLGVRVFERAPRLADWRDWAIAFVTNARIWVVGVGCIVVPWEEDGDGGVGKRLVLPCEDRAVELLGAIREGVLRAARREAYVVGSVQKL